MQNGSKYVPPHMRNHAGGGQKDNNVGGPQAGDSGGGGGGDRRSSSYGGGGSYRGGGDRRSSGYGGGGGYGGGYGGGGGNSRWNNDDRGSRGGYGGGGYGRRDQARRNERGYHGDTRPDKRLERQLFDKEIKQVTGINLITSPWRRRGPTCHCPSKRSRRRLSARICSATSSSAATRAPRPCRSGASPSRA
mmetsp:Transcript_54/g.135  ORF Transcript_54/g.135 Transcript_54/m.135 type:complete len:191 (-) Transcript_54:1403-1975(-)